MAKWFRAKTYGYGWYPSTWQGWIVILVWAIIFTLSLILWDHEWLKNTAVVIVATTILIYICYKKGEKAHWNWGKVKK